MVTASDRSAVSFSLSGGAKHDSPEGMKLRFFTPACRIGQSLLMDRAYEGDLMRAAARKLVYNRVVPPKKNRIDPWEYDRKMTTDKECTRQRQGLPVMKAMINLRANLLQKSKSEEE